MDGLEIILDGQVPLWLKVGHTLFVAVLVPVYWRHHGPQNFLWFSDVAMLLAVPALWMGSSLLASIALLATILPEVAWNADFIIRLLTRRRLLGLADYMFDRDRSILLRGLSLFHLYMPWMLLWLVWRLGYDPRALPVQTLLAWAILLATYALTDPRKNINWAFGPTGGPQRRIPAWLYLVIVMVLFPLVVYLPTHALLRWWLG